MTDTPSNSDSPKRNTFAHLPYYLRWWIFWAVLFSAVTYVGEQEIATYGFWPYKVMQIAIGAIVGAICAVIFAAAQNSLNSERGKAKSWVFAIVIWVAIGMATRFAFEAWRQFAEARAIVEVDASIEDMRQKAATNNPQLMPSEAFKIEARKLTDAKIASAAGDANKQASIAADHFVGYYFVNTRTRPAYCLGYGVNIDAFRRAFEEVHKTEAAKAASIHSREGTDEEKAYQALSKQMERMVDDDMKGMAAQKKLTMAQACQLLVDHAEDIAQAMSLAKTNPGMRAALLGVN